jgi:hypothetical protein
MAPSPRRARRVVVLRVLLVTLVVANLLFFAFTRGSLDGFLGLRALGDREPERLANQVRPETIRLLPMSAAASAPVEATACYETPTFAAGEAAAVEAILASSLPAGAWADTRGERAPGSKTEVTHTYRVADADAALAAKLAALKLDPSGRGFSACAKADRPR